MPNDETDDSAGARAVVDATGLGLESSPSRRSGRWPGSRRAHRVTVLHDISFTIRPGSAVGCLGTPGAGRTSLVELLIGATAPTTGTVRTCGLIPGAEQEALSHRVGVVAGHRPLLWPDLSLDESLRLLAGAHHLPDDRLRARRAELVDRLDLAAFIALPSGQLSPARRVRAEIAAALLPDPELLILDEPTRGLDALGKEQVRAVLRQEHRTYGRTLLLATAHLADVEQTCDRLLVLDRGRLVHDGDLAGLLRRAGAQRTLVAELAEPGQALDDVPGTTVIEVAAGGLRQRLGITGGVPIARVLADVTARPGIRHLTLEEPDLAELISRL